LIWLYNAVALTCRALAAVDLRGLPEDFVTAYVAVRERDVGFDDPVFVLEAVFELREAVDERAGQNDYEMLAFGLEGECL